MSWPHLNCLLYLAAQINILSWQSIRNARYKLAGSISFPVVLVLTSQMSNHDLINHAAGILLILNGALEPQTKPCYHSPPALHALCTDISSQPGHSDICLCSSLISTCITHVTPHEFIKLSWSCEKHVTDKLFLPNIEPLKFCVNSLCDSQMLTPSVQTSKWILSAPDE